MISAAARVAAYTINRVRRSLVLFMACRLKKIPLPLGKIISTRV
jgi:hypothetical protein